jgi:hypothetical protein
MITKRSARRIREGITAGRQQARFEKQYSHGGPRRFNFPGYLNARDGSPEHYLVFLAYWHTLGRSPGSTRNF